MRNAPRTPWPELALAGVSLVLVFAVLEIGLRLRLRPRIRAALPHVGLGVQDHNRLRWLERHATSDASERGGELRFDQPDPLLGWAPVPNLDRRRTVPGRFDVTIHTTADGIRGPTSVPRARLPGRTRIAIFGCSQTFGAEVEDGETYAARLQDLLVDTEVLNFGVHGFGTDQMLLRWERDGVPFQPDVVIVGFAYYHMQRNLDDFRFFAKPRFTLEPEGLRLVGVPVPTPDEYVATAVAPRVSGLLDRSVLLRWAWKRLLGFQEGRLYAVDSSGWVLTRALLDRFIREVHEHGARFVLLNLEGRVPQLQPALAEVARADGALFVNAGRTLGHLRGQGRRLRVRGDPHWGAEGHATIARDLAQALCAEGVIPAQACP